ncbi:MAG: CPBP family intramembrane metalloprotease [Ignavibacteria bacterium]|jgi:membrane protease YdiL (CAAX protease family)|nr:CPBP family intramembrane metalloprotease [Ignavibacteria bacterium]
MEYLVVEKLNSYRNRVAFYAILVLAMFFGIYAVRFGLEFDKYSIFLLLYDYISVPLLLLSAVIIDAIAPNRHWYSIGISLNRKLAKQVVATTLMGAGGIALLAVVAVVSGASGYTMQCNTDGMVANTIWLINAAVLEELVFRGYVFQNLCQRFSSNLQVAVILGVSSVLFSVSHFFARSFDLLFFINVLLAGVLLGLMYIRSSCLWLSICFHITWNWTMLVFFEQIIQIKYDYEGSIGCSIILIFLIFVITLFPKNNINEST